MHRATAAAAIARLAPSIRAAPTVTLSARQLARMMRISPATVQILPSIYTPLRRLQSTDAKGGANASTEKPAGEAKGEQAEGAAEEEVIYEEIEEPFVAKLSRWVWTTIKFVLISGVVGVVLYAGYTIVVTLLPAGASANAIMRRASEILKADEKVTSQFPDLVTYGEDFGSRAEGRRYYVPDYTYNDPLTDVKYHRVKFNIEGAGGKKGTVWAEVRHSTYEFRYIIVLTADRRYVISVKDDRPEPRSMEERIADVTTLIQDSQRGGDPTAGWRFYTDNQADIDEQKQQLGQYAEKVRYVRCDQRADDCAALGLSSTAGFPVWARRKPEGAALWDVVRQVPHADVERVRGVKDVSSLERMTKDLRRARDAGAGEGLWASVKGFFGGSSGGAKLS